MVIVLFYFELMISGGVVVVSLVFNVYVILGVNGLFCMVFFYVFNGMYMLDWMFGCEGVWYEMLKMFEVFLFYCEDFLIFSGLMLNGV